MSRPPLDEPALRTWRDQTLYRLLLRASRIEVTTTLERIHAAGFEDVTVADANFLANLDTNGTIISALARRAGVTRQAASQQIAHLERAGYVERRPSNADGRAAVIFQTERGLALLNQALDIVDQLEVAYEERLGSRRFATLKRLLTALVESEDPSGLLGRD